MKVRGILAGLLLLTAGAFTGCEETTTGPFEGDWISATAGRLSFEGSRWSDDDGDAGLFTYAGVYPDYTVVLSSGGGTIERHATFQDARTFKLCTVGGGGALVDCDEFVLDEGTVIAP